MAQVILLPQSTFCQFPVTPPSIFAHLSNYTVLFHVITMTIVNPETPVTLLDKIYCTTFLLIP